MQSLPWRRGALGAVAACIPTAHLVLKKDDNQRTAVTPWRRWVSPKTVFALSSRPVTCRDGGHVNGEAAFAKQRGEKVYTCVFPVRGNDFGRQVLLGFKKRGFGEGTYDGFGGKLEAHESIEECARRELEEESGLTCSCLQRCAEVVVHFGTKRTRHYIFIAKPSGKLKESDEMVPRWFDIGAVPYEQMWPDIREWLPQVLQEENTDVFVRGYFEIVGCNLAKSWLLPPVLFVGSLPPSAESELCRSVELFGPAFSHRLSCSKHEFDMAWKWTWAMFGVSTKHRLILGPCRSSSTADAPNRILDKQRVETNMFLAECGNARAEFRDRMGNLIARGYQSVVYGDHGPYLEFTEAQIWWPTFMHHVLKGPARTHFEHYNNDGSVKLYDQFKTVVDQPNPPPGEFAMPSNRVDGYADYRAGCIYVPCDKFFANGGIVQLPID